MGTGIIYLLFPCGVLAFEWIGWGLAGSVGDGWVIYGVGGRRQGGLLQVSLTGDGEKQFSRRTGKIGVREGGNSLYYNNNACKCFRFIDTFSMTLTP